MAVIVGVILIFSQVVFDLHVELNAGIVSASERDLVEHQPIVETVQHRTDDLVVIVGRTLIKILIVFQLVAFAEVTLRSVRAHDRSAFRAALGVLVVVLGEQREIPHGTEISSAHFVILLKVGCLCLYYNYR